MFVRKNFSLSNVLHFSGVHIIWLTLWFSLVVIVYELTHFELMRIPLLPLTIIGTAVAFYVGFKNNQAYDRLWEARKIWGAIVNSSRAWGSTVKAFVTDYFSEENLSEDELYSIKKRLIYRHIAWLYCLRSQLLIPTEWEHINQGKQAKKLVEKRRKKFGVGLLDDEITEKELHLFLPENEYEPLINYKNSATQIIDYQSQELKSLRDKNIIEDFRHMELQNILNDFYVHQGKAERIKKFPLPRQFGGMSLVFVGIFIFLLPFGMLGTFHDASHHGVWLTIPLGVLVSWVYLSMELVGDYSENPFEGTGNDIPMHSLCRVIEIDLREMLGEKDLPPAVQSKNGVLM